MFTLVGQFQAPLCRRAAAVEENQLEALSHIILEGGSRKLPLSGLKYIVFN